MASSDPIGLIKTWELSPYELNRSPQKAITENTEIAVSPESLHSELMCPICLDILKKTMTSKKCLHRFCSDCIETVLRSGKKECPTCRKKLFSKKSLRLDPSFDILISKIYPSRDEYEAHASRVLERLNMSNSLANLVQSTNEGIKLQTQNQLQQTKKNQYKKLNESIPSTTSKPSNSLSQSRADNVTREIVQTELEKNIKSATKSEKEAEPASTVETTDMRTDCDSTSNDVSADEIELVFKPHPKLITSNNQLIKCLKDNSVRYIKTTDNATVDHLTKYLAMQFTLDFETECPEQSLHFFVNVPPNVDQFVSLKGNQTLRNIHDRFWKVNKPLEIFYSLT